MKRSRAAQKLRTTPIDALPFDRIHEYGIFCLFLIIDRFIFCFANGLQIGVILKAVQHFFKELNRQNHKFYFSRHWFKDAEESFGKAARGYEMNRCVSDRGVDL